jgi:alanine dehydrogenase
MIVGVPKEIKTDEERVALVPSGVSAFVNHGHSVLVESGAGNGSGIHDADYRQAGAEIVDPAAEVWDRAEMIIKVKEPLGSELDMMKPGQIIYTYLHLASNEALTKRLIANDVIAVGYETIQLADGSLPLLMPMSEVAGRLSVQKGAQCLEANGGGRGILLSGVSGVKPANVVILGAGVAGSNACFIAVGLGANVTIMDTNPAKMRYVHDIMGGHVNTLMSNRANIEEEVAQAELVIGSVLIAGAKAPQLISEDLVRRMRPGAAIVDIAIDQGGCAATSRPTTHSDPTYVVHDVVHYCVANMPGAVPRTSTYALTNVTLSFGLDIANKGIDQAAAEDPALAKGVNIYRGQVAYEAVAETFGLDFTPLGG